MREFSQKVLRVFAVFGSAANENESPNEETADADAKQNAALPILPIATGGAILAVLLAVVLLAVKKRKTGKESH